MPDVVGFRAKLGVVIPATNTVVEHDFNKLSPPGVTVHTARIETPVTSLDSDAAFLHFLAAMRQNIYGAVDRVMSCEPDILVMGMSSETFLGGAEGSHAFERGLAERARVPIVSGAGALNSALHAVGARRLSILTPYQPAIDKEVIRFLTDCGYEVVRLTGLQCPSATAIARVTRDQVMAGLAASFDTRCDALVQVGTNLAALDATALAEATFERPFVPINVALMWQALRTAGITEPVRGLGQLLSLT